MEKCIYQNALRTLFVLCLSMSAFAKGNSKHSATGERQINIKKAGLDFIENKGQWTSEAKFKAEIPDGALFLTDKGFVYNYASREDLNRLDEHHDQDKDHKHMSRSSSEKIRFHAYKVIFEGAHTDVKYITEQKRNTYHNYFLGNDKSKWAGNVGLFGKITQQNIYNGIDVQVYSKEHSLKYDFIVKPGADVSQIRLSFDGVTPGLKPDGSLYIKTSVNEIRELAPYTYQVVNGKENTVPSRYTLVNNKLSFEFPEGYDHSLPLIIDPVLVFATYSGGTNTNNYSYTTTYDAFGNLYAGSECWSTGWPATSGAYLETFAGTRDVGINKYNATGSNLIYSTYYGGSNYDLPHAMKVNELDELVLIGSTVSGNIPLTAGCYDNTLGGLADMFVAHFSASGANLMGSSYLGGSGLEPFQFTFNDAQDIFTGGGGTPNNQSSVSSPVELAFDPAGNIWVVGNSNSTDIDIVANNSQNTYTVNKWICQGSTYTFGTQILNTSGNYTQTFTTISGCDSVVKLHLTIGPGIARTVSATICPGSSYAFGTQNLTVAGTYNHTFTSVLGCDSAVTLNLYVKPYITKAVSKQICAGTNYVFGPAVLTQPGTYVDTFSTSGCDSIVTLSLTIKPYITHTDNQSFCPGKSYAWGGQTLSVAGTFVDTFSTSGCDSIVTLHLSVQPYVSDTVNALFCAGSSYTFGNQTLTSPGTYTDTQSSFSGCDRIVTLHLNTGSSSSYTYFKSICQGSSYPFGQQQLTTPGSYTHTFSTTGCDSVVTINLAYRPNITNSITRAICPGSSYTFGSQTLTSPGTYTATFPTAACDSAVTLALSLQTIPHDTVALAICQGTSYVFGPNSLLSAGTYTHTFTSAAGCDSIVTLELSFNPYITSFVTDTICYGGSYTFGTQVLTTAGTYMNIYPTSGCDSVVTLALSVRQSDTLTFTENYCSGSNYYFGGNILTAPGTYLHTFASSTGCDSVVRLLLTGPWNSSNVLSGGIDVVLFKLDPTCSNLMYSGYMGGTGDDSPTGLLFNHAGNLIVTGITASTNFPTTTGTLSATAPGGTYDGFVTIINPVYGNMVRSTYVGTTSTDQAVNAQIDDDDNVYVLGRTTGNYPVTTGVYAGNPTGDIFIDKLDPLLNTSLMSTRVGNNQTSSRYFPSAFLVDICRNVYVAGFSANAGMPLSSDAYQTTQASFWFGVLKPDFAGLLYGSYFGVSTTDHNHIGVNRLDPNGIVYHSICNANTTFTGTTPASWSQNKQTSGQDIMSFKFNFEATGVHSDFELTPGQNDTGCAPYTVQMVNTSNSAISYIWDFGDGSPQVTAIAPQHTYADSSTFTIMLHAINPGTCITDDTSYMKIRVLRTEMPDIVLHDTVLCTFEQSIDLAVQINNPSINNVIAWGPPAGILSVTNQAAVTVDPSVNNIYYVTVKDTIPGICGFSVTDTVHIDLAPRVLDILNNDTVVCEGATIQIRGAGTPAYQYRWSPATGVSDSTILEPVITVNQPAIYTITGSYYACPDTTVTLNIGMHYIPHLHLSDDISVCQRTQVALESNVTPYRSDYIYQWTPVTPNMSNSTLPNINFVADTTITYSLHVETPIGCEDKDSITITVFPGNFGAVSPDTGYCPGNQAALWATGGVSYTWTPAYGLSDVSEASPIANPSTSTDYTVYIRDEHNCVDTEYVSVQVYPEAVIAIPDSINIYPGERYHLEPGSNAAYFKWFPPSGISDINIADPVLYPEVRTRYFVTATTELGCMVLDSLDVLVKETVIDMPNAFVPSGVNNLFKPSKRGITTLKEFSIYNRWGNKVYSSSNIESGWDGTYNGQPQPVGVYIYSIEATNEKGVPFTKKGNVTLIR